MRTGCCKLDVGGRCRGVEESRKKLMIHNYIIHKTKTPKRQLGKNDGIIRITKAKQSINRDKKQQG